MLSTQIYMYTVPNLISCRKVCPLDLFVVVVLLQAFTWQTERRYYMYVSGFFLSLKFCIAICKQQWTNTAIPSCTDKPNGLKIEWKLIGNHYGWIGFLSFEM